MRRRMLLLAIAACGRLDFDALQRSDGNTVDGDGMGPLTCTPWSMTYRLMGSNVATANNDWDPSFGPDGQLIFSSDRTGDTILMRGVPDGNGDFTNVMNIGLHGAAGTQDIAPTWSGRRLYFSSTRSTQLRVYQSDYDTMGVYSQPVLVAGLGSTDVNGAAVVGDEMLFNNAYNLTGAKLYRATRNASDIWTVDRELDELDVTGDGFVTLSSDHLTVMFESQRTDGVHSRIFTATRSSPTGRFGTVTPVAELDPDAGASNGDPELSPDQRTMYFASDRAGGAGADDIYRATRTCQ